jgi:hypothetical protein
MDAGTGVKNIENKGKRPQDRECRKEQKLQKARKWLVHRVSEFYFSIIKVISGFILQKYRRALLHCSTH